jgi:malate dehydrogenase
MVPCLSYTEVSGIPIAKLIPEKRLNKIIQRTRDGGAEIVQLLKSGSAFYAPSAAVAEMIECILMDQKKILPCAVLCQGEYGLRETFVGVPILLGAAGMLHIVEIDLSAEEKAALIKSAESVSSLCEILGSLGVSP